eukprot:GFKZ01002421.1.p1 GENE.GFKZ01002421.1~~GFKZ01002421.1.p1  ORF type:complete len:484 (-),score=50.81 GFKZ01002421.1:581-2032(-)
MAIQTSPALTSTNVAIVGAGPTGYLAAIALYKQGVRSVTIIDRQQDPTTFHRNRAYTLCIYQLGQRLLRQYPDLFEAFKETSLESSVREVTDVSRIGGKRTTRTALPSAPVYWLMRSDFIKVLATYVEEHCPGVTLLAGHWVEDLILTHKRPALKLSSPTAGQTSLSADLIIACDGSNSHMRNVFRRHQQHISSKEGFAVYSRLSPSVGMCPKGLGISTPIISPPGEAKVLAEPHVVYRFHGESFDLLFLPVGASSKRIAMLCVKPDHDVWRVSSVDEAFNLFERNFPQLRIRDLFSEDEMKTFVAEKPMSFTPVARPMSLVGTFGRDGVDNGSSGVLFLGDAAHSFPPDTAQGINSALEDVRVLRSVLEEAASWHSLQDVLKAYERQRDEEIWDLMALARSSSPYQYEQNWIGSVGHKANKALREALSKVAPALFHPMADTLIRQNYEYSEVRRMSDRTTQNLTVLALAIVTVSVAARLALA